MGANQKKKVSSLVGLVDNLSVLVWSLGLGEICFLNSDWLEFVRYS